MCGIWVLLVEVWIGICYEQGDGRNGLGGWDKVI
jgi:hypothetical protein